LKAHEWLGTCKKKKLDRVGLLFEPTTSAHSTANVKRTADEGQLNDCSNPIWSISSYYETTALK
jgi:hypothetical protein